MVDPLGLALGVPGVLDILLRTSLEGYRIFSTAQTLDEDFAYCQHQFNVQHQKLSDWATILKKSAGSQTLSEFFVADQRRFQLIVGTLTRIAHLFANVRQLEDEYGVKATAEAAATIPKKKSFLQRIRRSKKGPPTPPSPAAPVAPIAPPTLSILNLGLDISIEDAVAAAPNFESAVSSYAKFKWVVSDKDKLQALIDRLEKYNDNLNELTASYLSTYQQNHQTKTPMVHFMVPFPRNDGFIGTSHILSWVKDKDNVQRSKPSGHRRIALCGLGGVGKTQDVLDFAYEFEGSLPVFWIHSGSVERFEKDYRQLAALVRLPGYDNPKQDIRPIVKNWLESPESGEWILVLDNADNKLDFFPQSNEAVGNGGLAGYIPRGRKGTIAVTTRDREVACLLAGANVLSKDAMDQKEAQTLFKQRYPSGDPYQNTDDVSHLLQELQYLPLAIIQVAAYLEINHRTMTPASYLKQFRSTRGTQKSLLSKQLNELWRDTYATAETVLATFSITFRQIQEQSPLADSLLRLMACIDRQGIPHELLASSQLAGCDDKTGLEREEALGKLINLSLLQITTSEHDKAYEIHSLVHLCMKHFLSAKEWVDSLDLTAEKLTEFLPNGEFENWKVWRMYLPHATALIRNITEDSTDTEEDSTDTATLCYRMSWYLREVGRYSEAEFLARRSVTARVRLLGKESQETLDCMANLVETFWNQGRWKEAVELGVKVIEARTRVLGQEHPDTLMSMANLAATFWNQGRWKEAEELEVKAMEANTRVLGQEHPSTLMSMADLASTFQSQGRWKEAEELDVKVMEANTRMLGQEHPDTLTSMANLASTFWNQGRWKEAEELEVKVMEARTRVLGQEHPDSLMSMANLASTFRSQGRWKEAEDLQMKVMEARTRVLGQEHPSTLKSMANLASTFRSQGRWKEAEDLQMKVMEARTRVLGQEHPSTLKSMANLAHTYKSQDRIDEAIAMMAQAASQHIRILGKDHPDTESSIHFLNKWRGDLTVTSTP